MTPKPLSIGEFWSTIFLFGFLHFKRLLPYYTHWRLRGR